ncbi:threonine-phosphate decarboxylase [Aphanothece hegewaldii CCALA 016]|uniref:threonine-phosphate decarboxylase n=1 Tax=Aphanothece hegewaldii CCALA 016 TaxID=2107694 RepID=A0A2T1LZ24_9CHRO|nr:threonine-phosphate decarboxylase CobD [Aphanothece hegewaldii]PSF37652.1 threonine-phosphate decarboxylase [Aphanothece hegewaldii CCALA 016]
MSRPLHGGNLAWAATIAGCPEFLITDFSASINPLGPPKSAIAAIQSHLATLKHYPDPNYTQLRSVLAQEHHLSPDWIIPGNGVAELLTWAARDLAQKDMTCLLSPAFGDYTRALKAFNGEIQYYPLDIHQGNWEIKRQNLQQCGLLLNNPHNPTGHLFSLTQILPYLDFGLVVVDEAFMDFIPPPQQQSLIDRIQDYPNLIILRSLTKFYSLPGLRIGYAIAHPDVLKRWQQWRDPWPINSLADIVAQTVIQDREFQELTWKWLLPAKEKLFQDLSKIPNFQPILGKANYLLVKTSIPSSQLQKKLLIQNRILIRDCLSFAELGEDYFRIAIRSSEENERLFIALTEALN